ncbi:MAG: putative sulfate exporter family transporter [Acidobacteriaceae bacterium]|nr:putative sulfate exporter family transporter [Acidobacteriaceae bacterium]
MRTVFSSKFVFAIGLAVVATGLLSPALALAVGIGFGLLFVHPFEKLSRRWAKWLLQLSVVFLGFGMDIGEVVKAGRASVVFTAIGISAAMALGLTFGKWLKVRSKAAFLVSAGTAICGGSAIAAIAPITDPDEEELAMSLGTVFTLNSVALVIFPIIGWAFHLSQTQFGLWAALAIHDTSSVVGAAAKFGPHALAVGTVVKLTRALWIVPVALVTALLHNSKARVKFPWFIVFFCLAAAATRWFPPLTAMFNDLNKAGHIGLGLTLFLIGTGISLRTIRSAGTRVMAQGVLLWLVVAMASLFAIRIGWISL